MLPNSSCDINFFLKSILSINLLLDIIWVHYCKVLKPYLFKTSLEWLWNSYWNSRFLWFKLVELITITILLQHRFERFYVSSHLEELQILSHKTTNIYIKRWVKYKKALLNIQVNLYLVLYIHFMGSLYCENLNSTSLFHITKGELQSSGIHIN